MTTDEIRAAVDSATVYARDSNDVKYDTGYLVQALASLTHAVCAVADALNPRPQAPANKHAWKTIDTLSDVCPDCGASNGQPHNIVVPHGLMHADDQATLDRAV